MFNNVYSRNSKIVSTTKKYIKAKMTKTQRSSLNDITLVLKENLH